MGAHALPQILHSLTESESLLAHYTSVQSFLRWEILHMPCRYAQRSKASRLEWAAFTKEYFLERETLANVLLLVDSSIPVQACTLPCSL